MQPLPGAPRPSPADPAPSGDPPVSAALATAWHGVRSTLQRDLPPLEYATWIEPLHVYERADDVVVLAAPNCFVRDRVRGTYGHILAVSWEAALGAPIQVEVVIAGMEAASG